MIEPETLVIANRAAMFAAAAVTFGAPLLLALCSKGDAATALAAQLGRLLRAASGVLLATTALALPLATAVIAESFAGAVDPVAVAQFASTTGNGRACVLRIVLAVLAAAAAHGIFSSRRTPALRALLLFSGLVVASFALTGHTQLHQGGLRLAHEANHVVHVLAGLFWIGALIALLTAIASGTPHRLPQQTLDLLRAFSGAGLAAVTLVALTGTLNTWLILGHPPRDWSSLYQTLLAGKIATVCAMLGLAAANRFILVPRVAAGADASALRLTIVVEVVLGALALALVAAFGTLEPV